MPDLRLLDSAFEGISGTDKGYPESLKILNDAYVDFHVSIAGCDYHVTQW